ncbi:MAG: methyltransferase [Acidobacteria bacterium]|nr:MAG: methyltransferase [Acidobacteriota bacterium]
MNEKNGFTTPIRDSRIEAVLSRLHAVADVQEAEMAARPPDLKNRNWGPNFLKDKMIPIHREQGAFLYLLARSIRAETIVEFGTSHGLSTIYLAAAIRDNGTEGQIIGTEFVAEKMAQAQRNLEETGLARFVRIREGDARQTLRDLPEGIDMCLMDGFPPYSLEVFRLIAPRLRKGAIVVVDGTGTLREAQADFLAYLRDPGNGFRYTELPIGDGTGLAVKDA